MLESFKLRYHQYNQKYGKFAPATFFVGGVFFDLLTLGRIDQLTTILQESLFLLFAALILAMDVRSAVSDKSPEWLKTIWTYHVEIIHFLFGGLLSAFTIFYFKSSSGIGSFVFILLLVGFLVLNETQAFKKQGVVLRWVMFSLCLWSFIIILVPVISGEIGIMIFLLSTFTIIALLFGFLRILNIEDHPSGKKLLYSSFLLPVLGLMLYFFEVIPPVPLSVQYMGIYHDLKKENGSYILSRSRPWWKFWQNGDQDFDYRSGDRVYVFTRIFSPTDFKHQIKIRWIYENKLGKDELRDVIPFRVSGGREKGFRGYAFKENVEPGNWKVSVETEDGREIASMGFAILSDTNTEPRNFVTEVH